MLYLVLFLNEFKFKLKFFIRASNAPHRSLPAIPISTEPNGDTCSDLYATVGDKMQILQEEDMMSRKLN